MSQPVKNVLAAPLPARWGWAQRLKNTLLFAMVRFAFAGARLIPFAVVRAFALLLGHVAHAVDAPDRRRALANLALAMPELAESERRRIVRRMFVHLAVSAAEAVHLDRFITGRERVELPPASRAVFEAAMARGHGVMAVSGHIGNWELLAQVVAAAGYPIAGIAKPLYDPRLTRWVHRLRTAWGMRLLWRGDTGTPKALLRVFKDNATLAMLIDQDTRVHGAFVPFFGRPAHTPTAAASLALRAGAAVVVGWAHRHGRRHVLHFEACDFTPTGESDADVERLTAELNRRLEAAIRQLPEQWVWLHDRWKRQPVA